MRRYAKWSIGIILVPFALFIIIGILLYIPPIQRYLVTTATQYASEASGMDVRIGRLSLSFPLNLVVHEAQVIDQEDTLLNVDRLTVKVQLLPLLQKRVEIDGIGLNGASVNTGGLIEGMRLKGELGELFLRSHGVELSPETAVLNNLLLKDAHFSLCMADTTESVDTAASESTFWKIRLEDIDLKNVSFAMQMPLDTMDFRVKIGDGMLRDGLVDLRRQAYTVNRLSLRQGEADFNTGTTSVSESGLDPSHIQITDINIGIDSVYYEGNRIRALIREFELKERSGLEVTSGEGRLVADDEVINVPSLRIQTPDSYVAFEASADWSLTNAEANGNLRARLMAEIGKPDLLKFVTGMPEEFEKRYPSAPLSIQAGIDGSLKELHLTGVNVILPESFRVEADGVLTNLLDSVNRQGNFQLLAAFQNMGFLKPLTGGVVIPSGMNINGDMNLNGNQLNAELDLKKDSGRVSLIAGYHLQKETYHADLEVDKLNLHDFMPEDSLFLLSAAVRASGEGFDFFSPKTFMEAEGGLNHLEYGSSVYSGVRLNASLKNSQATVDFNVKDNLMDISSKLEALLHPKKIEADMNVSVRNLDLYGMGLTSSPFKTSEEIDLHLTTDMKASHQARLSVKDVRLITPKKTFKTKDLHVGINTAHDSIRSYANAGDLTFLFRAQGGIDQLVRHAEQLTTRLTKQWNEGYVDLDALKEILPNTTFYIFAKNDNPLANMLAVQNISFNRLFTKIETSPAEGVKGKSYLYNLRTDSLELDTIYFNMAQEVGRLAFRSGVIAGNKPFQEAFDVSLNGGIEADGANVLIEYLNGKKECGARIGLVAKLQKEGISLHVSPDNPILVYRQFKVSPQNYVYLNNDGHIEADLGIYDEQHTGFQLYSTPDSIAQQDLTLALNRIDIAEFRRIIPYMPDIAGVINAEVHYVEAAKQMQVSADMSVNKLAYNKQPLGDWALSAVYLPKETGEHRIDGFVTLNDNEIVSLSGSYLSGMSSDEQAHISAEMGLHHFPLELANAFVPDRMAILSGDIDGTLSVDGATNQPLINGEINLDSVNVFVPQASLDLRFDNRPVRIADSHLTFDKFQIFTRGKTPFVIDGDVDMTDFADLKLDLRMDAYNFEVLNAKRTKESIVYGKLYIDFDALLKGSVTSLNLRGNANILGTSDFTYILQESPLTVEDRLGETVTFVNFSDTTGLGKHNVPMMTLGGLDMLMTLHIDEAVQCRVDLDENGKNYMMFEGGGDLSFQYTPEGNMLLNGRYSLMSGELKYQMPVIPLKTFYIRNGSYIEWTGNVMNPNLNIHASERVRASVAQDGQNTRTVNFDVGVSITNRLENLGFMFTLEAPDDGTVQNELAGMSAEERNKLAVTMLVTGMYLAEGNNTGGGGLSANSMLNSFLESQINKVAGSALKTIDVNFGMEQTEQGGNTQTDYNFQFAKRFWNNRFSVIIGGKVSTGNNAAQQDESFIDNISLEYRLDNSGTRYIKIFHDKNYENVLDGEVTETGVGIVLRKKISKLSELFIFKNKKKKKEPDEATVTNNKEGIKDEKEEEQ